MTTDEIVTLRAGDIIKQIHGSKVDPPYRVMVTGPYVIEVDPRSMKATIRPVEKA